MDKLSAMRAFAGVVEHGSFAAAARALGQSRSAINRFVITLEEDLGVQLFNRTTRSVTPTAQGEAYYTRVAAILDALEDAECQLRETQTEIAGQLRIAAPMSFGILHLASAVSDFMSQHPKLTVDLQLSDRQVDLVEEGYDLAIRIAEPDENSNLVDFRICTAQHVLCASPTYLKMHGRPKQPADLKHHACLIYGDAPNARTWRLKTGRGISPIKLQPTMRSNNGDALCQAAIDGRGLTLLPTFIVGAALQTGQLITVMHEHVPQNHMLMAIHPPSRNLATKVHAFIDFLTERYGKTPPWDLIS